MEVEQDHVHVTHEWFAHVRSLDFETNELWVRFGMKISRDASQAHMILLYLLCC